MKNLRITQLHPRRLAAVGVLLSVAMLAACKAPQATETEAQVSAAPTAKHQEPAMDSKDLPSASADKNDVADLEAELRKGMAYGDFRKRVLAKGWAPVVSAECRAHLAGEDAEAFCAKNPQLTSCKICDELPELDSCSSDAHCLVRFRHPGEANILEAVGYGEVQYWSETGEDAGLQVSSWEFTTSPNK